MSKSERRFPWPEEVELPPKLKEWEEMYPPHYLFSRERDEWEKRHFWYADRLHAPDPMPPLELLFFEGWQIALSQNNTRVYCIPTAQGIAHRVLGCYVYITPANPPPEGWQDIIKEKAELFNKRAYYTYEHYDEIWEDWLKKVRELGEHMRKLKVPDLPKYVPEEKVIPLPLGYTESYELMEAWNNLINMMLKGWQFHFQMLNLAYVFLLMLGGVCKELTPEIDTDRETLAKMVRGVPGLYMFRAEEELCRLVRLATTLGGVAGILKMDITAQQKIEELKKTDVGRKWLEEYNKASDPWFYMSTATGWFHYEGNWLDNPDVPFGHLKKYVEMLERGERIERDVEGLARESEEAVKAYLKRLKTDKDRKKFEEAYKVAKKVYRFAEDHIFWIEHWLHTIWFMKVREFGRLLVKHGMIKETDDIFLFNRFEAPIMIEDLCSAWAVGVGVPSRSKYWLDKVEKRKKILEAAKEWTPPPALGVPPPEISEPFTIMNWGITTEKVKGWLAGLAVKPEEVTELKGFPASPGVAEGTARVVISVEQLDEVRPGEILVCKYTNPAWAPVFTRIKATITDIGGMITHAAIVSREYGIPAVTGTGIGSSVVKTGDLIRVDGNNGTVAILKRAA